jgi:hypothetical protein
MSVTATSFCAGAAGNVAKAARGFFYCVSARSRGLGKANLMKKKKKKVVQYKGFQSRRQPIIMEGNLR